MRYESNESFDQIISDFTLGIMDGLTVPVSVATGLVATNQSKNTIITAILAEAVAGSISMGLSNYTSINSIKSRKNDAFMSGIRTSIGYLFGAGIPLLSYIFTDNVRDGFYLSIVLNITALIIFGSIRSVLLQENMIESVSRVVAVGITAMVLTYYIVKMIRND